jgi:hypothetical protein
MKLKPRAPTRSLAARSVFDGGVLINSYLQTVYNGSAQTHHEKRLDVVWRGIWGRMYTTTRLLLITKNDLTWCGVASGARAGRAWVAGSRTHVGILGGVAQDTRSGTATENFFSACDSYRDECGHAGCRISPQKAGSFSWAAAVARKKLVVYADGLWVPADRPTCIFRNGGGKHSACVVQP